MQTSLPKSRNNNSRGDCLRIRIRRRCLYIVIHCLPLTGEYLFIMEIPLPPSTAGRPALASNVVVKFQSKSRRGGAVSATGQKMRRDFFEHDTRRFKANAKLLKWPVKTEVTADQSIIGPDGTVPSVVGTSPPPPPSVQQLNSKARRAAKFREMKVLQKMMLSKEMNFSLANLKPALVGSSCRCHCKCNENLETTTGLESLLAIVEDEQCTTGAELVMVDTVTRWAVGDEAEYFVLYKQIHS